MSAPDHWRTLTDAQRMEMEKHARGLVRGSIIEDAASRFMAMCMAEAIGRTKDQKDLRDPMQNEQVKALVEAIQDALGRYQVTHIHEGLASALRELEEKRNG